MWFSTCRKNHRPGLETSIWPHARTHLRLDMQLELMIMGSERTGVEHNGLTYASTACCCGALILQKNITKRNGKLTRQVPFSYNSRESPVS
jgi:hypothetical protein